MTTGLSQRHSKKACLVCAGRWCSYFYFCLYPFLWFIL